MDPQTFIDDLKTHATELGQAGNVLPALIVAQGILESGAGQSELAQQANNIFGIKSGSGWTGAVYEKESPEWSEEKGHFVARSTFRKYETIRDCVRDLVEKYHTPRYIAVLGERDFQTAARATWLAGYATDPKYPEKLYTVYQQYNLSEGLHLPIKKITVDAGHAGFGVTPGKRGPDGKFEWIWNNAALLAFMDHIEKHYEDVRVVRVDDPTGKTDVSLETRVSRANAQRSDCHISFHHNAMGSAWRNDPLGTETYINSPVSMNPGSYALANAIHPRIIKNTGLKDRGIKALGFYMIKYTNMPAVLLEGGFMDSRVDRAIMDSSGYPAAFGEAVSDGAAAYLNLKPKTVTVARPVAPAQTWYRIRKTWDDAAGQLAAFLDLDEAKAAADRYTEEGYKVFGDDGQMVYDPVLANLYRVRKSWRDAASQIGAYANLETAWETAAKHEGYFVYDGSGNVKKPPVVKPASPPPVDGLWTAEQVAADPVKYATAGKSLIDGQKWAMEHGISDGTFPNNAPTRAEQWEMMRRFEERIMNMQK